MLLDRLTVMVLNNCKPSNVCILFPTNIILSPLQQSFVLKVDLLTNMHYNVNMSDIIPFRKLVILFSENWIKCFSQTCLRNLFKSTHGNKEMSINGGCDKMVSKPHISIGFIRRGLNKTKRLRKGFLKGSFILEFIFNGVGFIRRELNIGSELIYL